MLYYMIDSFVGKQTVEIMQVTSRLFGDAWGMKMHI